MAARTASRLLRPLDKKRASEHFAIAANSKFVAQRIEATWAREAQVLYPPVAVTEIAQETHEAAGEDSVLANLPTEFILGVSRFVTYKRLDQAILVGKRSGMPVVLAGRGPDESRLRQFAQDHYPGGVTFVDSPSTPQLRALYRRASLLVFAAVEDFGIIPVEAMAAGTPVIAGAVGGTSETVIPGVSGALVANWNSGEEVDRAIDVALSCSSFDCEAAAMRFDAAIFREQLHAFVSDGAGIAPD